MGSLQKSISNENTTLHTGWIVFICRVYLVFLQQREKANTSRACRISSQGTNAKANKNF